MTSRATQPDKLIEWGVATRAFTGQAASGDRHAVQPIEGGVLLAAVDGLGHGAEAAAAADVAVSVLQRHAHAPLGTLLDLCHDALLDTRGVVMSVAVFDKRSATMTWVGVGNVEGLLVRGDPRASPSREGLLLRAGVVGFQVPTVHPETLPVAAGDTLVFATDGVRSQFAEYEALGAPPQAVADRVLQLYGRLTDDALVLVARFLGG